MTTGFAGRNYKDRATAELALHHYVYNYDLRRDILPKDLDPTHVTEFIQRQIREEKTGTAAARQIVELADFYNLRSLASEFLTLLKRQESTEPQFLTSLVFTEGVGILGEGETLQQGVAYFRYLLGLQYTATLLPELLRCYNEYSLVIPDDVVQKSIQAVLIQLNKQAARDPAAGTQMREVEDLHNNVLPRIALAAAAKRGTLSDSNLQNRLDRLVDIYLNLNPNYREWLLRWAGRQLLREFEAAGSEELVQAFRRGLSRVEKSGASEEARRAIAASGLRAIEFLGGPLSDDEFGQARSIPANSAGLLTLE